MKYSFLVIGLLVVVSACNSGDHQSLQFESKGRKVPDFNADSAYSEIVRQVKMGPRNPGSSGHQKTRNYLVNKFEQYAGRQGVFVQHFTHKGYQGDTLQMSNIIASFNPKASDRIMLSAHWDTRPRADRDPSKPSQPILGADDGGSGVAVLLELARIFHQTAPPIGVDIILFDGEDYGKEGDTANYFLGSRYWSNHPPVKGYQPRFGILLDMVGGQDATFYKEGFSMQFAPALVNEIWDIANQKGYGSVFVDKTGAKISDDHVIINQIQSIPMIDIINHTKAADGSAKFAPYWHTQNDNLKIIDKQTLEAVGEVLTELIYNRI